MFCLMGFVGMTWLRFAFVSASSDFLGTWVVEMAYLRAL